jgi:hypothetical protein
MKLTKSQTKASHALKKMWALKCARISEVGGITNRTTPLIVGPSGTGKSALVNHFCRSLSIPMITLTPGTWIVVGAKAEPPTTKQLANFLRNYDQGVIFLDEVNKLRNNHLENPWMMSVFNEILALLDGDDRLVGADLTSELIRKMKSRFMIVGAGAWQDEWNACRPTAVLGFGGKSGGGDIDEEIFQQQVRGQHSILPDELLFRFNERFIFLLPLDRQAIAQRIQNMRAEQKAKKLSAAKLDALVDEAYTSGRSMRWLESYVVTVMEESGAMDAHLEKVEDLGLENLLSAGASQKKFDTLYASLFAILQHLTLESGRLALSLRENFRMEPPAGLAPGVLTLLEEFFHAADNFCDPLAPEAREETTAALDETRKKLSGGLDLHSLGESLTKEQRHQVATLRVKLTYLDREKTRLIKVLKSSQSLKIEDKADPRLEWFKAF